MKRILQYLFGLLLLAVLLSLVEAEPLISALSEITLEVFIYLMLVSVLLIYISALKWQLFLRELGNAVHIVRLFNLYLVGYFVNMILPSFLGGDAVRSFYAGKKAGQHQALAATILERYTGFVAMILLGLLFSFWSQFVTTELALFLYGVAAALVLGTLIALSDTASALLLRLPFGSVVVPHLMKVQEGFHLAGKNKALLLKALLLSLLFHMVTVVNVIVAAWAVGWNDPPAQALFVVLPFILLLSAIPLAPGGLGIQEGAYYYFLQLIGATPAEALGVGIVLRAKVFLLSLIGGVVWLNIRKKITKSESSVLIDQALTADESVSAAVDN